jgi:hypothetical protein
MLKRKVLAFCLVATSALGNVLKGQWGIPRGPLLDGFLLACLILGVSLWIASKRMESKGGRHGKRDKDEKRAS